MRGSPDEWAKRVARLFDEHEADAIIAERNFGGEMVRKVIQSQRRNLPVKLVTASRGKVVRAEPVAALYEQGRVTHMRPMPLSTLVPAWAASLAPSRCMAPGVPLPTLV